MRCLIATIALLAVLVLAAPVAAKGPVAVDICGKDDCTTVMDDFTDAHGPASGILNSDFLDFGDAPPPSPYYSLELKADWTERDTSYFVPSTAVLRVGSNWLALGRADAAALLTAIGKLAPFPPPRLTRAVVGGRHARDAAPYFALLGTLPPADYPPALARKVEIVLTADRANPWTDVRRPLEYYPRQNVLHRYVEWLRVPPRLASVIERDAGLVAAPKDTRSTWPSYLAITLLGLGLVAVVALNQRARRRVRARARSQERPTQA